MDPSYITQGGGDRTNSRPSTVGATVIERMRMVVGGEHIVTGSEGGKAPRASSLDKRSGAERRLLGRVEEMAYHSSSRYVGAYSAK